MPKRSNDFQRLVKTIHDAFSEMDSSTVTESALLAEPDGTTREIDILVERRMSDIPVRLAIECRDRSRKSDIEWIDGLIGKFRNLSVDKVVAVSRRGFSAAATTKAASNRIELRVLSECLDHEWRNEFIRLGVAMFEFAPRLRSVELTLDPAPTAPISPHTAAKAATVASPLTVGQLVVTCFNEHVGPRVKRYVEEEFLSKLPALADLTRSWELTVPVNVTDTWITTSIGTAHRLVSMKYEVLAESRTNVSAVRHYHYGSAVLASEAIITSGESVGRMRMVQVAGKSSLTISFSPTRPRK
jgi:hypothetical protein